MKDYLQPAAIFALALAIGSLPFTVPMGVKAYGDQMTVSIPSGVTVFGCGD